MESLSLRIKQKRGDKGIRAAALEIGVSAATLSRVEAGKQPDLKTFAKICKWLNIDPATILGLPIAKPTSLAGVMPQAHFRAPKVASPETVNHLATLILKIQEAAQA